LLFSFNPWKSYNFAPKERGGRRGGVPYTSLCLCSSYQTPLSWCAFALGYDTMHKQGDRCLFLCAGGVSFSYLSPFLFRFILSCLQSSFSIKNETDRDRTPTFNFGLTSFFFLFTAHSVCGKKPKTIKIRGQSIKKFNFFHQSPTHIPRWVHLVQKTRAKNSHAWAPLR